ncbi:hypothetical protein F5884DRAFT_548331 [Xylogone sp. PMI_703]|nr:hypothetical protein F5884DRAFT_548331 [Xylogone sp. PMI_703]
MTRLDTGMTYLPIAERNKESLWRMSITGARPLIKPQKRVHYESEIEGYKSYSSRDSAIGSSNNSSKSDYTPLSSFIGRTFSETEDQRQHLRALQEALDAANDEIVQQKALISQLSDDIRENNRERRRLQRQIEQLEISQRSRRFGDVQRFESMRMPHVHDHLVNPQLPKQFLGRRPIIVEVGNLVSDENNEEPYPSSDDKASQDIKRFKERAAFFLKQSSLKESGNSQRPPEDKDSGLSDTDNNETEESPGYGASQPISVPQPSSYNLAERKFQPSETDFLTETHNYVKKYAY